MTNSSQSVTGTLTLDGFGNYVASSGSSSNPYMFAATSGYRNDGDAGLSHVGARYYDAQVGWFITRDTHLDQHPYLYCEHDPVNNLDPTGHEPETQDPNFPTIPPKPQNPPDGVSIGIPHPDSGEVQIGYTPPKGFWPWLIGRFKIRRHHKPKSVAPTP